MTPDGREARREAIYDILRAIRSTSEPTSGARIGQLTYNETVAFDALVALSPPRATPEGEDKDTAWVLAHALAEEWIRTYSFHKGVLKNAWEILARCALRSHQPAPPPPPPIAGGCADGHLVIGLTSECACGQVWSGPRERTP